MRDNKIQEQKQKLRCDVTAIKKNYSKEELHLKSDEVFSVLEITGQFRDVKHILIYNAMPDEVSTKSFIEKWCAEKTFYIPIIKEDSMSFAQYDGSLEFAKSKIGVYEPITEDYVKDFSKIEMVIVPGVAFDRACNRLGRGKAYYDRFLAKHINLFKVGVCFDFQLLDAIPYSNFDVKMDMLVSENDLIW